MKFFYLSAHVSVARDYEKILRELGHEVEGHNLSHHLWTRGQEPMGDFGGFNLDRVWAYSENDGEKFYNEFKDRLAGYDAFIACYPPCFARLFTRWRKPILQIQCVRYDFMLTDHEARWRDYQDWYARATASGQLLAIANNAYDSAYAYAFTGEASILIPSLCDYTGVRYAPSLQTALLSDTRVPKLDAAIAAACPSVRQIRKEYGRYRYEDIVRHKAIVHVPYNASVMTFFEHYAMGIPILVPEPKLLLEWKREYGALQELVYNQHIVKPGSFMKPGTGAPDPNDYEDFEALLHWMPLYDHYRFPHVQFFSSLAQLNDLLEGLDGEAISKGMTQYHAELSRRVHKHWQIALEGARGYVA